MPLSRSTHKLLPLIAVIIVPVVWAVYVWLGASDALEAGRDAAERAGRIDVVRAPVEPPPPGSSPIPAVLDVHTALEFSGAVYLAGKGGVERYDRRGVLTRRWDVGFELPRAPVTDLAVGLAPDGDRPTLIAVTAGQGVALLESNDAWVQLLPAESPYRDLTSLLPLDDGRILLGTERSGVLAWDASGWSPLHPDLADLPVTALAGEPGRLWIGALDQGVVSLQGGSIERYSVQESLPDARVLSLAVQGNGVYVGTASGVSRITASGVERTLAEGVIAAAVAFDQDRLFVGSFDQGVAEIDLRRRDAVRAASWRDHPREVRDFAFIDDELHVVAPGGARSLESDAATLSSQSDLHDRNISALLEDSRGRLWVGYFDRGLDVLAPDGRRLFSIEDDLVFCVNRLVEDPAQDSVYVATANGLAVYSLGGRLRQVLRKQDGLFADHVTDLVPYGQGWAIATPAGLNFWTDAGIRGVYALQGLVNNHVYALAARDEQLLAGTLGGLSLLEAERVRQSLSTADSDLGHNWISAAQPTPDGWLLGTYGAGVQRLSASGDLESFPGMVGVEVNPNALEAGSFALAGTLDRGVLLLNPESNQWTPRLTGLPSPNVTAVARGTTRIYLGTDNGLVAWPIEGVVF